MYALLFHISGPTFKSEIKFDGLKSGYNCTAVYMMTAALAVFVQVASKGQIMPSDWHIQLNWHMYMYVCMYVLANCKYLSEAEFRPKIGGIRIQENWKTKDACATPTCTIS